MFGRCSVWVWLGVRLVFGLGVRSGCSLVCLLLTLGVRKSFCWVFAGCSVWVFGLGARPKSVFGCSLGVRSKSPAGWIWQQNLSILGSSTKAPQSAQPACIGLGSCTCVILKCAGQLGPEKPFGPDEKRLSFNTCSLSCRQYSTHVFAF